jgi:hypothetical protein
MIVAGLAVLCAGLFAGAALYVSAVEHRWADATNGLDGWR